MARQSSPGGGRSSSSHGYRVTSPVATDQGNCPDSGQPQRTPSLPVKAIWPLDHTGGPDDYTVVVMTAKILTPEDRQRLRGQVAQIVEKQAMTPESLVLDIRKTLRMIGS